MLKKCVSFTKFNGPTASQYSLYSVVIPFYRLSSTLLGFMLFPAAVTSYCQVKCGKWNTYCGKSIRKSLSQVLTGLPQLGFPFPPFHSKIRDKSNLRNVFLWPETLDNVHDISHDYDHITVSSELFSSKYTIPLTCDTSKKNNRESTKKQCAPAALHLAHFNHVSGPYIPPVCNLEFRDQGF